MHPVSVPAAAFRRSLLLLSIASLLALACLAPGARAQSASPERLPLWPGPAPVGEGATEEVNAFITLHRPANPNGAAVVICPGGGYGGLVTGGEGSGIARWLNTHGLTAIVLEYRLPKGRPMVPLLDAQRAIRTVRAKAKSWDCDPSKIGIMGFSAGGHLASTAATRFDDGEATSVDSIERASCRPDFAILVYPVITMGEKTHGGSRANLLGPAPSKELINRFSNETQVTSRTAPTFLTHAVDDHVVPVDHSRMFLEALRKNNVPAEYLELPSGDHGLNGYKGSMWDAWQTGSLKWLAARIFIPEPVVPPAPSTPAPVKP
ncbi:MAG: alpha/beta hydrolase [Verrucomicrobiales bacterium]